MLDTYGGNATGGDANAGTITSPTFTVSSPYIDLQVAGGEHENAQPDPTAVNLMIGGKVVATATGNDSGTGLDELGHQRLPRSAGSDPGRR